jgi:26S proteasome regulatory subunit N2
MATGRDDLVDDLLKRVIYETDNAIAGEAAGIATGLIRVGHGSAQCIEEMLQFAHDTKHEKIVRGIAMGVALSMLGACAAPNSHSICTAQTSIANSDRLSET